MYILRRHLYIFNIFMEQLKVQNNLLMQLVKTLQNQINSKNRQNQILFQQYEQLAFQNNSLQTQLEAHRSQAREIKKPSPNRRHSPDNHNSQVVESQLKDLRRRVVEYKNSIETVETELKKKASAVIELQNSLQKTKAQLMQAQKQAKQLELFRQSSKKLQEDLDENLGQNDRLKERINQLGEELINMKMKQQQNSRYYEDILQQKTIFIAHLQENIAASLQVSGAVQNSNQKIMLYEAQISQLKEAVAREQNDKKVYQQFSNNLYNQKQELQGKLQQLSKAGKLVDQNGFISKQAYDQRVRQLQMLVKSKDCQNEQLQGGLIGLSNQIHLLSEQLQPQGPVKQLTQIDQIAQQQVQPFINGNKNRCFESIQKALLQMRTSFVSKQHEMSQMQELIRNKDQNIFNLAQLVEKQAEQLHKQYINANLLQQSIEEARKSEMLKQTISQLQHTISTLQQSIQNLTNITEQQKLRIEQLQNPSQAEASSEPNHIEVDNYKKNIQELQHILKDKEQQMGILTKDLELMNSRIVQLEQQLQKAIYELQSCRQQQQSSKIGHHSFKQPQLRQREQMYLTMDVQLQTRLQQKRSLLGQLQLLLQQKQRQVQNVKNQLYEKENRRNQMQQEMEEKQRLYEEVEQTIAQAQQEAQYLEKQNQILKHQNQRLDVSVSSKQATLAKLQAKIKSNKEEITKMESLQSQYQQQLQQLQQQKRVIEQIVEKTQKTQQNAQKAQAQNVEAEKEEQMAGLMDVMRSLQEQIRSKQQTIETLSQQISCLKLYGNQQQKQLQPIDLQLAKQLSQKKAQCSLKQQKLQQLEQLNLSLRQTINDLSGRLNTQQLQVPLQQQYDVVEMQQEMLQNTQAIANQYKQELQQIKEEAPKIQNQLQNQHIQNIQEQNLTALQALQKLLIYSEGGEDIEYIRVLVGNLRRLYAQELQSLQCQNRDLHEKVSEWVQINKGFQTEIQRLQNQNTHKQAALQQKSNIIQQLQKNVREIQDKFSRQIQGLRSSIFDETPLNYHKLQTSGNQQAIKHQKERDFQAVNELKQVITKIKRENKLKDQEIIKLRPNFVKQLNDLLADSCINNEEDKQILQRVTLERDELVSKCHDYQEQIKDLELKYTELANQVQNNNQHPQGKSIVQDENRECKEYRRQDGQFTERANQKAAQNRHCRSYQHNLDDHHSEKQTFQYEELQLSLGQKNQMISELQGTILQIEKGFNAETMSLRRNVAQLNNEIIRLRKKLYQSNPNAMDLAELIKGTFAQQATTDFFKYQLPNKYSQASFLPTGHPNSSRVSYNTEYRRRKTEFPQLPNDKLTLGEKIIGRRCRGDLYGHSLANGLNTDFVSHDIVGWQSQVRP